MHCHSWPDIYISSNRTASRFFTDFGHIYCTIFWLLNWLNDRYVYFL